MIRQMRTPHNVCISWGPPLPTSFAAPEPMVSAPANPFNALQLLHTFVVCSCSRSPRATAGGPAVLVPFQCFPPRYYHVTSGQLHELGERWALCGTCPPPCSLGASAAAARLPFLPPRYSSPGPLLRPTIPSTDCLPICVAFASLVSEALPASREQCGPKGRREDFYCSKRESTRWSARVLARRCQRRARARMPPRLPQLALRGLPASGLGIPK